MKKDYTVPFLLAAFITFLVVVQVTSPVSGFDPGQAPPSNGKPVPVLTDIQRLTLQGRMKDLKIAELTVQAAVTAYKQAQVELQEAVNAVQQPCYDLKDDLIYVLNEKKDGCK